MKRKGVMILLLSLVLFFCRGSVVKAATDVDLEEYDFSQIQEILEEEMEGTEISFSELVSMLIRGEVERFGESFFAYLGQILAGEVTSNRSGLWQVLLLATVGALFANVTAVFEKDGVSEMGFFVTYLLLTSVLFASFLQAMQVTEGLVGVLLNFVSALLPTFFLAVVAAGGSVTALAFHELLVLVIALVEWIFAQVLLPVVRIFVVIGVINHLTKEELFAKTSELLNTAVQWGLKGMVGMVTGYSLVQSLILPQVDAVQTGAVAKILGALPGVGNGVTSAASLLLGSGALIKNGIGTAALIALLFLSVVPICKLAVIYLMYAAVQAIMEPISDKRIVGCVSGVASGVQMLLKIACAALLLFLILIAILCTCTVRT
ncbi:MAG: stage III sporulation protein AE [Lachnospiraceae bacterium]|nr:stage III sporulation protein AE [Lachnospiraceae bacterium]